MTGATWWAVMEVGLASGPEIVVWGPLLPGIAPPDVPWVLLALRTSHGEAWRLAEDVRENRVDAAVLRDVLHAVIASATSWIRLAPCP